MAILNYKDLNLSTKTIPTKTFAWGNHNIEVLGYVPVDTKYDIVMITLQKSFEEGVYNPIKLDMFYHLNLVYCLTNIIFSDEDREDESKLFDELVNTGFMDKFLSHVDQDEYKAMKDSIDAIEKIKMQYKTSAAAIVNKFVDDLPANAEIMKGIVDSFDKEKYQEVIDFAKAANGGRPIS